MDVNYVLLLFVAIIMALAYGILGFFAARMSSGEAWSWPKFAATTVYSVVVEFLAVQLGVLNLENVANWQAIFTPLWAEYMLVYTGLLYAFQKISVPVVTRAMTTYKVFPTTKIAKVDPTRKMDDETRSTFFNDNPAKQQILDCVDQAEAKQTYRYAIAAGAWEYLVEYGEVTGAKHYWYKVWGGIQAAVWKPISVECLENIRATGKFPAYNDLY